MSNALAPAYRSFEEVEHPGGTTSILSMHAIAVEFLNELAGDVSRGAVDLPCFPQAIRRIQRILADPAATHTQFTALVGAEPQMAALVMISANSKLSSSAEIPFTSLGSAISLLGHDFVRALALEQAHKRIRTAPGLVRVEEPLKELWRDSIKVATIARELARSTKVSPDQAFIAGLLHGVGRQYVLVRTAGRGSEVSTDSGFFSMVNCWQAAIGKAVLENWGFDEIICNAVGEQCDYDSVVHSQPDLSDILVASTVIAKGLRLTAPAVMKPSDVSAFKTLKLTRSDCVFFLQRANAEIKAIRETLNI